VISIAAPRKIPYLVQYIVSHRMEQLEATSFSEKHDSQFQDWEHCVVVVVFMAAIIMNAQHYYQLSTPGKISHHLSQNQKIIFLI